jgi:hypothetical protein
VVKVYSNGYFGTTENQDSLNSQLLRQILGSLLYMWRVRLICSSTVPCKNDHVINRPITKVCRTKKLAIVVQKIIVLVGLSCIPKRTAMAQTSTSITPKAQRVSFLQYRSSPQLFSPTPTVTLKRTATAQRSSSIAQRLSEWVFLCHFATNISPLIYILEYWQHTTCRNTSLYDSFCLHDYFIHCHK